MWRPTHVCMFGRRAKADLKAATDPFVKGVLDGRQLALKVCRSPEAHQNTLQPERPPQTLPSYKAHCQSVRCRQVPQ